MITGFEKIVEERILQAQKKGTFSNLPGTGQPIIYEDDSHIPEDLRLAHKILKNADGLPPELQLKKEIRQTEERLNGMSNETRETSRILKKLNYLMMKLDMTRSGSFHLQLSDRYHSCLVERMRSDKTT
jgi:hypothetical protein